MKVKSKIFECADLCLKVRSYQDFEFQPNRKDNETSQRNLILEFEEKLDSKCCIDKEEHYFGDITSYLGKEMKVARCLEEIEEVLRDE